MEYNIGQYIELLAQRHNMSQAEVAREIKVSRQSLSHIICGKRELSLQLAMKLEAYFSLPEGELMKLQALQAIQHRKHIIRTNLCKKLISKNAFWSYDVKDLCDIPDDEIIEKCFTTLDIDDIDLMFELYPRKQIMKVWREQMAIRGEYMQMLNVMIAMYYFGIKEPEKYIKKIVQQHLNKLLQNASRIDC